MSKEQYWGAQSLKMSSTACLIRVKNDLLSLHKDPPPGVFTVCDESNMTLIHALIVGPDDTPYEGGFFYFTIRCQSDYPIQPPQVKFMTTDAGRTRFNPNLYNCGKVCLSILGTWDGPKWSPAQNLSTLLISIQSLLCEKPYHNEPGREAAAPTACQNYSDVISHETLRVAVLGMLTNETSISIPSQLTEIMEKTFLRNYDKYLATVEKKKHLDGQPYNDPYRGNNGTFSYNALKIRLNTLHTELCQKWSPTPEPPTVPVPPCTPPDLEFTSQDNEDVLEGLDGLMEDDDSLYESELEEMEDSEKEEEPLEIQESDVEPESREFTVDE